MFCLRIHFHLRLSQSLCFISVDLTICNLTLPPRFLPSSAGRHSQAHSCRPSSHTCSPTCAAAGGGRRSAGHKSKACAAGHREEGMQCAAAEGEPDRLCHRVHRGGQDEQGGRLGRHGQPPVWRDRRHVPVRPQRRSCDRADQDRCTLQVRAPAVPPLFACRQSGTAGMCAALLHARHACTLGTAASAAEQHPHEHSGIPALKTTCCMLLEQLISRSRAHLGRVSS